MNKKYTCVCVGFGFVDSAIRCLEPLLENLPSPAADHTEIERCPTNKQERLYSQAAWPVEIKLLVRGTGVLVVVRGTTKFYRFCLFSLLRRWCCLW